MDWFYKSINDPLEEPILYYWNGEEQESWKVYNEPINADTRTRSIQWDINPTIGQTYSKEDYDRRTDYEKIKENKKLMKERFYRRKQTAETLDTCDCCCCCS
jgi:hypothetical protein